jgi:hypothetical protein
VERRGGADNSPDEPSPRRQILESSVPVRALSKGAAGNGDDKNRRNPPVADGPNCHRRHQLRSGTKAPREATNIRAGAATL